MRLSMTFHLAKPRSRPHIAPAMTAVLRRPSRVRRAARKAAAPVADAVLTLWDIHWDTYLQLDEQSQGTATRLTFFQGRLDIMTLSTDHERIKNTLHDLIVTHLFDEDIEFVSEGSATRRVSPSLGKEPDDSFIFGGKPKSSPDLVIEINLTSGGVDKLEFYASLQVPEIWIYQPSGLSAHALDGSAYKRIRKSRHLPKFNLSLASELANWPLTSKAVKEYRKRTAKKK
jgi:Uma2 family endonuclease